MQRDTGVEGMGALGVVGPADTWVDRPDLIKIPVSASMLDKMSQAMPAMRELARFAGGPRYEAYFNGGVAAQITKAGNLSATQHNGTNITEIVKLRSLRAGQIANLGFSFLTMAVGMEHMARIDRHISQLSEKVDEISAMLVDDLVAPIHDIAASMHRFPQSGTDGVSRNTAEVWARDLRRVRQRLISKVQRIPESIKPTDSFFWSSQVSDLTTGATKVREAGWLIQLLAVSDALLYLIADNFHLPMALDGVDDKLPILIAREVEVHAGKLMTSTDKDCKTDATGKRQIERSEALGATQISFKKMIGSVIEARNTRLLNARLNDKTREFCVIIENDKIVALNEVHSPKTKM